MIAPKPTALQHGPRPLPLFLSHLWKETENDPETRQFALAGLRRYQTAERNVRQHRAPDFVAGGRASLLHLSNHEGSIAAPIVLIPSLVNPAHILDLTEKTSLGCWLARQGHDVWLVDWGQPNACDAAQDLTQHVERFLLPLLSELARPPILIGYCLGGTLAIAAAQACGAKALAVIAAPWDFTAYPEDTRGDIMHLWAQQKGVCERLGLVPMEVLQSGFWSLDPTRTIRKYAAYARMEEGSDAAASFVAVEDWANDGAPLTYAAGKEIFECFYEGNATARGEWRVAGSAVALEAIGCPALSVRSSTDRIVPAAASPVLDENWELVLGHVGMIVSGRAEQQLWEPLSRWIAQYA